MSKKLLKNPDEAFQPLAERVRPTHLDDVIGHTKLLDPAGFLRRIVEAQLPVNLIFWGPPGSGKTTLARIIAQEWEADFVELSAVQAKKSDINAVIERARENQAIHRRTILFVDEIHRFNKAQQDTFLPHVEKGLITLIGATTENPSFEIIRPLLSRSRVVVLEALSLGELVHLLQITINKSYPDAVIADDALEAAAHVAGGDARRALGIIEIALQLSSKLTPEIVLESAQAHVQAFDKNGELHYDLISAFIKSMRGSDDNATLYYLARMLAGGEDPLFIARRMLIFASEDIGLAGNGALSLAVATFQAIERIGLPEGEYTLYHCATALARSKKSRDIAARMSTAKKLEKDFPDAMVPLHMRNAPTTLMKELGYNKDYKWNAGFQPENGFLPTEMADNKSV